jgi:hypothetical protein
MRRIESFPSTKRFSSAELHTGERFMAVFQPATRLNSSVVDPRQRVHYTLGMVLGVDDFVQESTWHSEALRQTVRDLIGHGTVRGLSVVQRVGAAGPEAVVKPGVAITPGGEIVRVPSEQCAVLNDWLDTGGHSDVDKQLAHREAVDAAVGAPNVGTLRIYVVLQHAECTTTPRPIPGEPCRSEDDVLVDSRIKDGFALSLRLTAPQQIEHQGARDFNAWLARVPVADVPVPSDGLEQFLEALGDAASSSTEPPFMQDPIPAGLVIPLSVAADWYRAALRVYVTDLRARGVWLAARQDATGSAPQVDESVSGLLLAALDLQLLKAGALWRLQEIADAALVDDSERPILLSADFHEQQLQHLLPQSAAGGGARIVAAGSVPIAAAGATPPTPAGVLGGLVAQAQGPGAVRVLFAPLQNGTAQYVVQVAPVQLDTVAEARVVSVVPGEPPVVGGGDTRRVFTLRVRDGSGSLVAASELEGMQLMVQVLALPAASA